MHQTRFVIAHVINGGEVILITLCVITGRVINVNPDDKDLSRENTGRYVRAAELLRTYLLQS